MRLAADQALHACTCASMWLPLWKTCVGLHLVAVIVTFAKAWRTVVTTRIPLSRVLTSVSASPVFAAALVTSERRARASLVAIAAIAAL